MTRSISDWRRGTKLLLAMGLLVGVTRLTHADPEQGDLALAEWSEKVWQTARDCNTCDALTLLRTMPQVADGQAVIALKESLARYESNLGKREETRQARIAEVRKDLDEKLAQADLPEALRAALELYTLATDKSEVLQSQTMRQLVLDAETKARALESEGQWLDAHLLFNRLHLLYEEDRRYEKDLDRLSQRLLMIRMYTPELLHNMRSEQLVRMGKEPLEAFNPLGEDWREKLRGIDRRMVLTAIWSASTRHLDHEHIGLDELLSGGIEALRIMATTTDLSKAFPSLAIPADREAWLNRLNVFSQRLKQRGERTDQSDLFSIVRDLVDENQRTVKIPEEAILHEFGNGAIRQLDEFSAIIWPDELEQFRRTTDGSFKGVGIQITLDDGDNLKVVTPLAGTPASRAGIRPGDLIRKIDGESTVGIGLSQAVDRITGEEGTPVGLSVEREGIEELLDFQLIRTEIPIHSVKGWKRVGADELDWDWFIDPELKVGYIRLTQFTRETSSEMAQAIRDMKQAGLNGLILDLRFNPGGLLNEAVDVASLFVDRGVVVTQEDSEGRQVETQVAQRGRAIVDGLPVVCLVNGGSASASEIVAGALQDHGRAIIVGERSFGKGSVQNVFSLSRDAAFKLTTQYYRLPNGRKIHRAIDSAEWGIEPDLLIEMLPSQMGDALELRQSADVIEFDEKGLVPDGVEAPDPSPLLTEGIDPQLETALLMVQSQVVSKSGTNQRTSSLQ